MYWLVVPPGAKLWVWLVVVTLLVLLSVMLDGVPSVREPELVTDPDRPLPPVTLVTVPAGILGKVASEPLPLMYWDVVPDGLSNLASSAVCSPVTLAIVCVWLDGANVLGFPVTSPHAGQRVAVSGFPLTVAHVEGNVLGFPPTKLHVVG